MTDMQLALFIGWLIGFLTSIYLMIKRDYFTDSDMPWFGLIFTAVIWPFTLVALLVMYIFD